jgi:cytochrome b subunit of formate dehydrogenase
MSHDRSATVLRHGVLVRIEHWAVAVSGILLLFSGIGQMPMYQRYGVTKLPGLGWSGDFVLNLTIHYVAAIVFMAAIVFHAVYHVRRRETAIVPRRGDLGASWRIVLATLGFGEEPKSDKFLAEQRVAYAVIGGAALVLALTGLLKVARNAGWLFLPPAASWVNTTLHNVGFAVFFLGFLAHLAAFALPANRPLLGSMLTGRVGRRYAEHRHASWVVAADGRDGRARGRTFPLRFAPSSSTLDAHSTPAAEEETARWR